RASAPCVSRREVWWTQNSEPGETVRPHGWPSLSLAAQRANTVGRILAETSPHGHWRALGSRAYVRVRAGRIDPELAPELALVGEFVVNQRMGVHHLSPCLADRWVWLLREGSARPVCARYAPRTECRGLRALLADCWPRRRLGLRAAFVSMSARRRRRPCL